MYHALLAIYLIQLNDLLSITAVYYHVRSNYLDKQLLSDTTTNNTICILIIYTMHSSYMNIYFSMCIGRGRVLFNV